MEIIGLKTFKAVVDEDGIRGAAAKLHTVQSNITNRVKKLEDELDTKLFNLVGRKLQLTPSGQQLYQYACQIIQLEYQATAAILSNKGSYDLRIGMPETFAAVHMPMVLKQLKQKHPEIHLKIFTDTSDNLVQAVLDNKVDCATLGNAPDHEELIVIPIIKEQLVMVTPHDDNYEQVMFVREEGCGYRKRALLWQQEVGRGGEDLMVMSSADGILGCIAAGLGYTIMGQNMVVGSRYEKALAMQPVSHGQAYVQLSLVYRKDSPLSEGISNLSQLFSH